MKTQEEWNKKNPEKCQVCENEIKNPKAIKEGWGICLPCERANR